MGCLLDTISIALYRRTEFCRVVNRLSSSTQIKREKIYANSFFRSFDFQFRRLQECCCCETIVKYFRHIFLKTTKIPPKAGREHDYIADWSTHNCSIAKKFNRGFLALYIRYTNIESPMDTANTTTSCSKYVSVSSFEGLPM